MSTEENTETVKDFFKAIGNGDSMVSFLNESFDILSRAFVGDISQTAALGHRSRPSWLHHNGPLMSACALPERRQ
jgi:ketosteroid isomerase-like protein